MDDGPLSPTLQDDASVARPGTARVGRLPWRLGSQFWVALLGGIPAVGAIAWINAGRLGMARAARWGILGLSLAAWALSFAVIAGIRTGAIPLAADANERAWIRLSTRIAGVLLYLGLAAVQRRADRSWHTFGGEGYRSLWVAGAVAVVVGWVLQLLALTVLHVILELP